VLGALADSGVVTWLRFNLSNARVQRWLSRADFLPQTLREVIEIARRTMPRGAYWCWPSGCD
jgi:hypothetical protein